jgi:hypothetical protein
MAGATQQIPGKERTGEPRLAILVKAVPGVPMEEAPRLAHEAGAVIPSSQRLRRILVGNDALRDMHDGFPCWSGTMTAYGRPGRTLREESERISSLGNGHFIVYTDSKTGIRYLFPVDEKYLDKKDCILAVNHPGFELKQDGKDWVVNAALVDLIKKFPRSDGLYMGDPKYEIPTGNEVKEGDKTATPLWRIEKRVGLVARGCVSLIYELHRRRVSLYNEPSSPLGVLIEVADVSGDRSVTAATV